MVVSNPVAFNIGNLSVYWYGIIIVGAILGGTIFAHFEAKRRKMGKDYVLTLFLWVVPLAIVFARVFYVIFHVGDFFPIKNFEDFLNIVSTRNGGLTIIGAIPGGALGIFIASRTNKVSFVETLDMVAPCMILGQALGRWGNFVNQELYGEQILNKAFQKFPFAVQIDAHAVYNAAGEYVTTVYNGWFQATFFYEMILNYIGFAVLLILSRKAKKNAIVFAGYLAWYGIVRAFMETIRTDAVSWGNVKIGVVGCALGAGIAIVFIVLIWIGVIKTPSPSHMLKAEYLQKENNCVTQKNAENHNIDNDKLEDELKSDEIETCELENDELKDE